MQYYQKQTLSREHFRNFGRKLRTPNVGVSNCVAALPNADCL